MSRSISESVETLISSLEDTKTSLQNKNVDISTRPKVSEIPVLIDSIKAGPSEYVVKVTEHPYSYGQRYNREDLFITKTKVYDRDDPLYDKKFLADETGPFTFGGPDEDGRDGGVYATFHLPVSGEYILESVKDNTFDSKIYFTVYAPDEAIEIDFPPCNVGRPTIKTSKKSNVSMSTGEMFNWIDKYSHDYYKDSPWTLTFDYVCPNGENVNSYVVSGSEYITLEKQEGTTNTFTLTIKDTSKKPGFVLIRFGINPYEYIAEDNGGNEAEFYLRIV